MESKWDRLYKLYIKKHLNIIPIIPNKKIPAINKWNIDCSCDISQIAYWYKNNENFNWALPCIENNIIALDLDTHDDINNGVENFNKLCKDLGIEEPKTLKQLTKSNGIHYIFKTDDDLKQIPGLANAFPDYPAIDIRNSNYILVEPSVIDGKEYKFLNNLEPQEMPVELKEYILKTVGTKSKLKQTRYEKPLHVDVGNRDIALFEYINNLYYKTRLSYDEILILANYFNEEILEEPLPERDVVYKTKKAFEKERPECILINVSSDENK